MIKKNSYIYKSVVSVLVLFVVAIVTLYGWRFYSEGQISTAYIQATETRDLEPLGEDGKLKYTCQPIKFVNSGSNSVYLQYCVGAE